MRKEPRGKGGMPLRNGKDDNKMGGREWKWNKEAGYCRDKNKNMKVKNLLWKRRQRLLGGGVLYGVQK
jgi:hypothetical protein